MDAPASPVRFDADGAPRSRRCGDVYFSKGGGLAESRRVFLAGCGLPERWAGRGRFLVGELGFGTGLNVLALLDLWRAHRPPGARLAVFSVEAEPLSASEARRALAAWPELADLTELLTARWPGQRRGFHRVDLPELGATLDVAVMDVADALRAWDGRADAWFLDGFAPAVNPEMWTDEVMALVARRSAAGARAATYTVAGRVRRALAAAGWRPERRPGFGAKRERLEAFAPGEAANDPPASPRVSIVGAGIAGAALARAFADQGVAVRVLEAERAGGAASGNPSALVTPRLDAGLGPIAQLHAQAFARACQLYERVAAVVIARGVLQLEAGPRDAARFAKIAASDLFEPGALQRLSGDAVRAALGEPAPSALRLASALVVEPERILAAWLPQLDIARVARLERSGEAWRLLDGDGGALAEAEVVCLAPGVGLRALWDGAPIEPVRGQLSWTDGVAFTAVAWGAYVAPTRRGVAFGATHDRGDARADLRAGDDARNLEAVGARLPALGATLRDRPTGARAAVRAATPDRLPIAGEAAPGLFVLGGFGARGFALAPLLAEHVAARALGLPSPLPAPLADVVEPHRFVRRARRRGMARSGPAV
ncbi:MAG TPA: tRNA (5-methylaminomethyl-2-thiouridine)(34)-methyltransferase MnmD [Caulobacteraceae bacterium]|nr:tRNA (5-methylaminomethyl-2-thiouridine)(34)-methyltransferase MnmD [Caulobacteraceae bacterium]